MATRRQQSQQGYLSSGRRTPIPNAREQAHEISVNYFLRCNESLSEQNQDTFGRNTTYLNAVNFKLNKKEIGSLRTPSGATVVFEIEDESMLTSDYKPLASCVVRDQFFVLWSYKDGVEIKNTITLDDKIILHTNKLGYSEDHHVDIDTSNNSLGGEVFMTDFNIPPVYFMIKDMVDNAGVTEKYFSEFDFSFVSLNSDIPLNQIVFKRLYKTSAVSGLPTGSYSYMYRLVSPNGDKTSWSPATPLIQVTNTPFNPVDSLIITGESGGHPEYYERLCHGDLPSDSNISECGVELWLRIDNRLGFNELELARIEYNTGAGEGTPGQTYLIQKISLNDSLYILKIKDDKSTQTSETLISIEQESTINSIIKRAKTIRYFNNKIQLGNIEYANEAKDAGINTEESSVLNLTHYNRRNQRYGMIDPEFRTYCKSLMDEERYSFAIVEWGSNMSRLNIYEPDLLKNILTPHRDSKKTLDEFKESLNTNKPGGIIQNEFGANNFDSFLSVGDNFDEAVFDSDEDEMYQFSAPGATWKNPIISLTPSDVKQNISNNEDGIFGVIDVTGGGTDPVKPSDIGLKYRHPRDKNEEKYYDFNPTFAINFTDNWSGPHTDYVEPFNKNPKIRSLCIGLKDIKVDYDKVKAFSVVRTKPAGRVVIQGLCTYELKKVGLSDPMEKSKDTVSFISSDIWNMEESVLKTLKNNPQRFKIKISRPQVFTTEVMSLSKEYLEGFATRRGICIDAISHPYYNSKRPDGNTFYSEFGTGYPMAAWNNWIDEVRSYYQLLAYSDERLGESGIQIEDFTEVYEEEGIKRFKIKIKSEESSDPPSVFSFYQEGAAESGSVEDTLKILENVYIMNIIDTEAVISNNSLTEYYDASCFIKTESVLEIINLSKDYSTERIYSVDERLEDFHINKNFEEYYKLALNVDKYIYIKRNGVYYKLYNINSINFYDETMLDELKDDIINGTNGYRPGIEGWRIYGVYSTHEDENGDVYINLKPDWEGGGYNFDLEENDEVIVRFDNSIPVKAFGDCYVGACTEFQYNKRTGLSDAENDILVVGDNAMFPYKHFLLSKNLVQNYETSDEVNEYGKFTGIRQLLWRFFCKSRSSSIITDGSTFPHINYIPRLQPTNPNSFDPEAYSDLIPEYNDIFPGERSRWIYGGFKPRQLKYNIDYLKRNENYKYVAQRVNNPFDKESLYPTRVAWSMTRPVQTYYAPGLKSFLPFNYKDIDDKNGQIVKIFNHKIGTGSNLMAFTEYSLYILMTNKRVLTGADNELVGVSLDEVNYIPQVIEATAGSNYGLPLGFEGSFAMNGDTVCWANEKGVFMMKGGKVSPLHTNARSFVSDYIQLVLSSGYHFYSYINEDTGEYFLSHKKNDNPTRRIYYDEPNPDFSNEDPYRGFYGSGFVVVEHNGYKMAKATEVPFWLTSRIPQSDLGGHPDYPSFVEIEYINDSDREGFLNIDHVDGSDDATYISIPIEKTYGEVKKVKIEITQPPEGFFPIFSASFGPAEDEPQDEDFPFEGDFYIKSFRTFKEEERPTDSYGGLLFSTQEDNLGYVSLLTYSYLDILSSNFEYGLFFDDEKLIIERIDDNNLENNTKGVESASVLNSCAPADSSFFDKEFIDIQISCKFENVHPEIEVLGETESGSSNAPLKKRGSYFGRFNRDQGKRLHGTNLKYLISFDSLVDEEGKQSKVVLNGSLIHYKTIK